MTGKNNSKTIVIKLGTSSIISADPPFLPHLSLLSSITETTHHLRSLGHRVVLVSSGAIGVGMRTMSLKERGKGLQRKQALAAIGQGRLIALWDQLFGLLDVKIAQVLLTRQDISDRQRYLNAQNTFSELLALGVVPIVNENDTVSVSEIKFGDNDTLSAIAANMVNADYLFLMTDVNCLYTDNPRKNPDARPVWVVRDIQRCRQQVSTATLGTSLGTGGMSTKLIAAELATVAGVTTVIINSQCSQDILPIIEASEDVPDDNDRPAEQTEHDGYGLPKCTRFIRQPTRLNDKKWWVAHGLHCAGSVIIDEGAHHAIHRRESGGRLLPSGVLAVLGTFASHQAVKLFVRRRKRGTRSDERKPAQVEQGTASASGACTPQSVAPSAQASPGIKPTTPAMTSQNPSHNGSPMTQPQTPNLYPTLSISSSIASLETLGQGQGHRVLGAMGDSLAMSSAHTPNSQTYAAGNSNRGSVASDMPRRFDSLSSTHSDLESLTQSVSSLRFPTHREYDMDEWEDVEIGKGLALYNSMEIDRLRGCKSSDIASIIGYSESAHVVDSIAFSDAHLVQEGRRPSAKFGEQ
ncbi:Glutamate 5-kinase [Naganishia albida]|nr:Glutamate 5-kinase [Naganishia albida]